jgi:hypothetical protein
MKLFVLTVQGASEAQRNAITNYLKNGGYGYWHWLSDFWIIETAYPNLSSAALRDEMLKLIPGLWFNVFAVRPIAGDWAGFGDTSSAEWLNENWKEKG